MGSEFPCLGAGQCSGPGAKPFPSKAWEHRSSSWRMPLGQGPSPCASGMPCRQGALAPLPHRRFSLLGGAVGLRRGLGDFLPLTSAWQALLVGF